MKKLVPKRRFEGFTDPWEQRKLGEVAKFSKGRGYSKNDLTEEGTPIILYGSLYTNYQTIINEVNTFTVDKVNSVYSSGNEVVVPSSGESAEDIARASAIVNKGIILGGDLNIIHSNSNIDPIFLALLISNGERKIELAKKAQGKSVVHLYNTDLEEVNLIYPTREEQTKIGIFFSNIDKLITLHQRKLNKLKATKSAYLSEMFPKEGELYPKRRFAGFTEPWEVRKLGEIGKTYTGLSGKTKEDFGHGQAEFVTYLNVFNNSISNERQTENVEIDTRQNEVEYGDIFFTTSSETPEEVGMSSVWLSSKQNVYLNSFCFGFRPVEKINPYYMAYMLRSSGIRKLFQILAQGISRYNISKTKAMDISVMIPTMEEQAKIGVFFTNLDSLITTQQSKLEKLQALKQAYLSEMFV